MEKFQLESCQIMRNKQKRANEGSGAETDKETQENEGQLVQKPTEATTASSSVNEQFNEHFVLYLNEETHRIGDSDYGELQFVSSEQLRAGLTTANARTLACSSKEAKDLTFVHFYSLLKKPVAIHLRYDWVAPPASTSLVNNAGGTASMSPVSMLHTACSFSQNQRQRFYIETLASVAASFLNDMQPPKNNVLQLNSHELNSAVT